MDSSDYSKILRNWRIEPAESQEQIPLPGSPDRTTFREAVVDTQKNTWVLEEIPEETYTGKLAIAEIQEGLKSRNLKQVHPYERNSLGQFITCYSGHLFMLRPHVDGIPLDRGSWLDEIWRAETMADFLIALKPLAATSGGSAHGKAFSIVDFVKRRTEAFSRHRQELAESLKPVFRGLEANLFPQLGKLPTAFCHGDFHPLNMIWGEEELRSVIDWEYCGTRPETYDAALLVGCIGFDDPDALIGEFATAFVQRLRDAQLFSAESWAVFFDLVIAIRYGWLSEWMRTHDESARDLEMLYMNLLTTQKEYIIGKWGLT